MSSVATLQHTYHKVSDYRGTKRIWLQGLKLASAGFEFGQSYSVNFDSESGEFKIKLDPMGIRAVSGKKVSNGSKVIPIIELKGEYVKALGENIERVRVDFKCGELVFSVHHLDRKQTEREENFKKNFRKGLITKGSLCSGIGVAAAALASGLSDDGIKSKTTWIVDREARYLQVAVDNNSAIDRDTIVVHGSLEEVEANLLPQTDLVQFSLGCTPHSKSGKTKNKLEFAEQHAKDATAVFGLMKIIDHTNPAIMVSENVVEAMNSASYTLIKSMLDILGYNVFETVLDETQAGSLESRKRYWFVAVSKGLPDIDLSAIDHFPKEHKTLADIIEPSSVTDSLWRKHDYLDAKQERDIEAGKGFKRALFPITSAKVNTIGRSYNKRRSTEPFIVNSEGLERLLTKNEHARVKGVPEAMVAGVVDTTAHEGLGQGILFNHGRGIGRLIGRIKFTNYVSVLPFEPVPKSTGSVCPSSGSQFSLFDSLVSA